MKEHANYANKSSLIVMSAMKVAYTIGFMNALNATPIIVQLVGTDLNGIHISKMPGVVALSVQQIYALNANLYLIQTEIGNLKLVFNAKRDMRLRETNV